ncbi:MAG: ABC transporter substrate-binding protein [Planctomycetota bacterium]
MRSLVVLGAVAVAAIVGLGILVVDRDAPSATIAVDLDRSRELPQGDFYRSAMPDLPSINPFTTVDAGALRYVLTFTHGALLDQDPRTGEPRAADAESWHRDPKDGRWHFLLRPDLRFADGQPVRGEDLEFTIAIARQPELQPKSDMAVAIAATKHLEAVGDREIVVDDPGLDEGSVLELGSLFRIAQRSWFLSETGIDGSDLAALARAVANVRGSGPGTGPYRIAKRADGSDDWVAGSHLNLVQNRFAWHRSAMPRAWNLAGFQHRFITEETTRLALLMSESIDWFTSGAGADLAKIAQDHENIGRAYRRLAYAPPQIRAVDVVWNCEDPELQVPKVRIALGHMFDRQRIVDDLYHSLASLPPDCESTDAEIAAACRDATRFDLDRAVELLEAVGCGPDGRRLRIEILCAKESPALRRIIDLAIPEAERCNVELVPMQLDYATMYARLDEGDFQGAIRLDYNAGIGAGVDSIEGIMGLSRWKDARAEELRLAERAAESIADRMAARRSLRIHRLRSQPNSDIVSPMVEVLVHRRFRDAEPGQRGLFPESWWVEPGEQIGVGTK